MASTASLLALTTPITHQSPEESAILCVCLEHNSKEQHDAATQCQIAE